MAKGGGFPGFGGGNIQNLMKQAQKMQKDMEKTQAHQEAASNEFASKIMNNEYQGNS